jgi:hypothetical protein
MPAPLALTDAQLDVVFRLAKPLVEADRDAFLKDVAEALAGLPELGEGIVMRTCVQVQRKYWHAPNLAGVGANDGVVCAGLG